MGTVIVSDAIPCYHRLAIVKQGVLIDLLIDDKTDRLPQIGAVFCARVQQLHQAHRRATLDLGEGRRGSMRLSNASQIKAGDVIIATVQAESRDGKPIQLRHNPADDLAASQSGPLGQVTPPPDLIETAKVLAPDAEVIIDTDGEVWGSYDLDEQIETALVAEVELPQGGIITISTPPGAAVIDGDSGASMLAPEALALAMADEAGRQIRLRRIGGPIVIDFPRLNHAAREKTHKRLAVVMADDPCKPVLHGWTKGGLYTLDRRHGLKPLAATFAAAEKTEAIEAMRRLMRDAKKGGGGLPPQVVLSATAVAWLKGDGAQMLAKISAEIPLPPTVISDSD